MTLEIRPLESLQDLKACVALQEATWGEGFSERVPTAILRVGQILGGVSAGAFDEAGELVGFVFGLTGLRDGELAHWSDMLAVRPGLRDTGLGRTLKAYQRDQVLGLGVAKMFWTFDPLQSRNAHLNLTRLGAVVREYRENMYGDSDSPLHQGIGTDRFVALWLLDSSRVETRLGHSDGGPPPDRPDEAEIVGAVSAIEIREAAGHPAPASLETLPDEEAVRVPIPSDVVSLKADHPELARAWREETRRVFKHYLGAGMEVCEFVRGEDVSHYLLTWI